MAKSDVTTGDTEQQGSASVHRALKILKCFGGESTQMRLSDIAHQSGLSISTVHRLLGALCSDGFIFQNPATERYEIGPELVRLGVRGAHDADAKHTREVLDSLAETTGESAAVAFRIGEVGFVAECTPSNQRLRFDHELGSRIALHASAMGKVILAFSSEDAESTVRSLGELERFTTNTQTAVTDLTADLKLIRERGWSRNHGERYEGVVGVAAPVFDASGKFVAAVGIQGPEVRVDQEVAVSAVLKAAEDLKGRLRAG